MTRPMMVGCYAKLVTRSSTHTQGEPMAAKKMSRAGKPRPVPNAKQAAKGGRKSSTTRTGTKGKAK
jgi:hypothetical protein